MRIFDIIKRMANKIIVSDSFNRADSASLGVADTGQTWAYTMGTFGIVGNKAKPKTHDGNGNSKININTNKKNISVAADIVFYTSDGSCSLTIRDNGVSNTNLIRARVGATAIQLIKTVSSTGTIIGEYLKSWSDGESNNLKIEARDDAFLVYLNDILIINVTDINALNANTYCGALLYKSGALATSVLDNFKVEEI